MPKPGDAFVHSSSAEEESLKLVEDFVGALTHAIKSLEEWTPNTLLDNYRLWSSKHLHRAIAGFAFLRRRGLVDSSKFLVRPAIEMMIRVEAARQHPDLFYCIAYAENLQDKHLLRIADQHKLQAYNEAQIEKIWKQFSDAFTKEFPTIPIPPWRKD